MNGLPNGVQEEGSLAMYSMKPLKLEVDVQLPNCMYHMNPINGKSSPPSVSNSNIHIGTGSVSRGTLTQTASVKSLSTTSTSTGQDLSSPPTNDMVESLELRQIKIIDKLTKLRDMITGIHEKCMGSAASSNQATSGASSSAAIQDAANKQVLSDDNIDIVVHANPEYPPYTLILFARLIENSYSNAVVSVTSHVHSSFKGSIKKGQLAVFKKEEEKANVRFTIIWKDVQSSTMIVTPVQSTTIKNEANIARFLSRLLPVDSSLNYDSLNWEKLVIVDSLLDQANESNRVLSVIETALKKSKQGFLASELTVADLVLYSSVAKKVLKGQKDIPVIVRKWVKRIETGFGLWLLGLSD